MKYLAVLLDEHMSWNEQIYQIKLKLNCTMVIFSKLRSHANLNTLRIAYYSLFQSHLQYGAYTIMGPEKSRNQRNNAENPESCS